MAGKGAAGYSGGHAGRSLHIPSRTGGEEIKIHGRALCLVVACGNYFLWKRNFRYRFWRKEDYIHIFMVPDCRGIRHHGRETPDKRICRTGQKILCQMQYSIGLVSLI